MTNKPYAQEELLSSHEEEDDDEDGAARVAAAEFDQRDMLQYIAYKSIRTCAAQPESFRSRGCSKIAQQAGFSNWSHPTALGGKQLPSSMVANAT
jgi:hypothetical protein